MGASLKDGVVVLGAGVNGACVARELILNRIPVSVVDRFDIAFGATSKSSRLIHGGLRYLEYGDVALVRESLRERARLLRLAPHFVRPLQLLIPVRRRWGGMLRAAVNVTGLTRFRSGRWLAARLGDPDRGLWTVRCGLWLYDWLTTGELPGHSVHRSTSPPGGGPRLDPGQFPWCCGYWDARITSAERFTIALLDDARWAAAEQGLPFRVLTRSEATLHAGRLELRSAGGAPLDTLRPAAIINATGAWGDDTLRALPAPAPRLFGGTRGSHLLTRNPRLRAALGASGVYAAARDGRPVFILPAGNSVLVGTTDERFEAPPETAAATPADLEYLIALVNHVFPNVSLTVGDVDSHSCGVRPLAYAPRGSTSAIPRGHSIDSRAVDGLPIDTLIGGKLTTCRALGEEAARRVVERLGRKFVPATRDRPLPGAGDFPGDADFESYISRIAQSTAFPPAIVSACVALFGGEALPRLQELAAAEDRALIPGTEFPRGLVAWIIRNEWVARLEDLVERRLVLIDRGPPSRQTLEQLAAVFAAVTGLSAAEQTEQLEACCARLEAFYGVRIV